MESSARAILLPYQQGWVNDREPLKIWLAARQIGKSFAIAMEAVTMAIETRCNNLILSSSERQSRELMHKVCMHMRYMGATTEDLIEAERETREEITLHNGSRIISLPANPDTVRGFSGNVFLDEFAFHGDSKEIWRAMYPTVTRGYKVRITSTPNGKLNMFHDLYQMDTRFSRHRTNIHDAVEQGLSVDIPAIRDGIGDAQSWAQEFECEFLDEATAYITLDMISACEHAFATKSFNEDMPSSSSELYLGIDVGRKRDLTVIWAVERVGDVLWTRLVHEMRGMSFSSQRETLFSLLHGPSIRRACMDATGIGAQLAEEAIELMGSRVEAVHFTLQSKEDLAVTAHRAFEDRTVRIPADPAIRHDIHSVRRYATSSGNSRFDADRSEGSHADRFWALALALHAAKKTLRSPVQYESIDERAPGFRRLGCW